MTYGSSKTAAISSSATPADSRETGAGLGETLGHSLMERIGNTPLLRLDAVTRELPGVTLLGKAGMVQPWRVGKGSRGCGHVAEAGRRGQLYPESIFLDATSGNTGIAYAMLGSCGRLSGHALHAGKCFARRKQILQGYGANIIYTDPADGSDEPFGWRASWQRNIPTRTSTPMNIRMMRTGKRITS